MISVSVCQPEALRAALAGGTLGEPGSLRVTGAPDTFDAAPGVAQVVTDPLAPGRPVEVFGAGENANLRVRAQADGAAIDARFDGVPLSPDAPVRVSVSRGGAVRAVTPDRRRLRPTAQRRTSLRRPAALRRVSARRRGGGAVRVRFPRVTGRVAIELRRTRGGRPVTTVAVSGRRGSVTVYAARRTRFVVARRLSATFIPSRARVARIR
jgi:hypothetical protein